MQESLLRQFNEDWHEDCLKAHVGRLPEDAPWRLDVLREYVKIDLRRHWEKGIKRTLESYLEAYPELGTPETVSVELIQAEIQARRRVGDGGAFADLSRRFPRQMQQLQLGMMAALCPKSGETENSSPTMVPPSAPRGAAASPPPPADDAKASVIAPVRKLTDTEAEDAYSNTIRPEESAPDVSLPPRASRQGKNRYRIVKELGRGAMGTVYLAQDSFLANREVALKQPHFDQASPELLERFHREVQSAASLTHPNICPVYDVGENKDGTPYLVMEYIKGETLTEMIRREKPLAQRRAAEIAYKLASALDEAHRHKVIHRDLKPANVMMNRRGEPVVMDFGLARRTDNQDARQTKDGSVLGTPAYMPPEQAKGEIELIGPASDQYSVGVILYEMLTGEVPFKGGIGQVITALVTKKKPAPPTALRPDLDPFLEKICLRAMALEIGDRYPSVADFALALEAFVQPSSIPGSGLHGRPNPAPPAAKNASTQRPGGAHSTLAPEFKTLADPPQGRASTTAVEESPKADTMTPPAPPSWQQKTAPAKPQGQTSARGVLVALLVLLGAAGAGAFFFLRSESPEAFQARVLSYARQGEGLKALQQIDAADQEEGAKKVARQDVRLASLEWAEGRLKDKQNLTEIVAVMDALLRHFPDDPQLATRRLQAHRWVVQADVASLFGQHKYRDACEQILKSGLAKEPWARVERARILERWAESAKSAYEDGHLLRAGAMAEEILVVDQENVAAKNVRKEASARAGKIRARVAQLLGQKQFAEAHDFVLKNWPGDEGKLKDQIYGQWRARADDLRDRDQLKEADRALAEIAGRFPEKTEEITALRREIGDANSSSKSAAERVTAAVKSLRVGKADFERVQRKLVELRAELKEPKQLQRIDALLKLLVLAEKGAADPLNGPVDALEAARREMEAALDSADRNVLGKIQAELFDLRVERSVPTLADKQEWEARLRDCDKVLLAAPLKVQPSPWVLACRVECLAELRQAGKVTEDKTLNEAWGVLKDHLEQPEPAVGSRAYGLYAAALALSALDRGREAAELLPHASPEGELSVALRSAHRKRRAVDTLLAAARELRNQGGSFREPFGPKGGADKAFSWLQCASRFAGPSGLDSLRKDLVLAAWHKTDPAAVRAGELVPELVRPDVLDGMTPQDAFRFSVIHARTRDASAVGRMSAVKSYFTALVKVRSLIHDRTGPDTNQEFRLNVVHPVCETFYASVIRPLREEKGRAALLTPKSKALDEEVARLAAASGDLIKAELPRWQELSQLEKDWVRAQVDLYHQAYRLASEPAEKAEYLVLEAYAYYTSAGASLEKLQEYAVTATKVAPEYAGGFGLHGIARIYESQMKSDWKDKLHLLQAADEKLCEAVRRADKLPPKKAEALNKVLYLTLGPACMELANYVTEKSEKEGYLQRGKVYVERLLKMDPSNLDGWNRYGLLLEDIGTFLGKTEKYYADACTALGKAMDNQNLWAGRTKPWMARGRVQVKWAQKGGKDTAAHLAGAERDLKQVERWGGETVEAVEALYWQAKLYALRGNAKLTSQSYDRALALVGKAALAKRPLVAMWREALLLNEGLWALTEASTRSRKGGADGDEVRKYLALAEQRAKALDEISPPRAGWIFLSALRRKADLSKKVVPEKELLAVIERGLDGKRLQDVTWRVDLLAKRARMRLEGKELTRDYKQAHADALAALALAERHSSVPAETKGAAAGVGGEACFETLGTDKNFPETIKLLRQAVAQAPKHLNASKWKACLAAALYSADPPEALKGRANVFEEAARNIAEAQRELPKNASNGLTKFVEGWQKAIEKDALPVLREAVEGAKGADSWRWHWRLAELLAADNAADALTHLAKAARGLPENAPEAHRQRIRDLRKELKAR